MCSQSKWPEEAGLAALWEDNKDSLLAFPLVAAYGGCVKGCTLWLCACIHTAAASLHFIAAAPARRGCRASLVADWPPFTLASWVPTCLGCQLLTCRLWGTVREEGSLRGSKGREVAPLGGANITGARLCAAAFGWIAATGWLAVIGAAACRCAGWSVVACTCSPPWQDRPPQPLPALCLCMPIPCTSSRPA